jgi:hypothetical protein
MLIHEQMFVELIQKLKTPQLTFVTLVHSLIPNGVHYTKRELPPTDSTTQHQQPEQTRHCISQSCNTSTVQNARHCLIYSTAVCPINYFS